ncbi:uncharacterized protein LOC125210247 [Salvia hispanica]|uniref:uncharacterized protein LOC125210247 n=1 Tax=Salvia hispanica TaxID=49212 RepID=UPI002009637F|nr:uncharacterized protein LOC125210247 [Salvia hispanica]
MSTSSSGKTGSADPDLRRCRSARLRSARLAYGTTADMFDEYLHVGETTGPNVSRLFGASTVCTGSGRTTSTGWRGQFTSGYKGNHPTMILEAVADHRLWIWHAYFGVTGSNNDINVLNSSTLFADQCRGCGPAIEFTANGRRHHMGYYLADGIYPRWLVFLKTISCQIGKRRVLFAKQESARKGVERAFGVLQSWWAIVKGPARFWYNEVIADVMYVCVHHHA